MDDTGPEAGAPARVPRRRLRQMGRQVRPEYQQSYLRLPVRLVDWLDEVAELLQVPRAELMRELLVHAQGDLPDWLSLRIQQGYAARKAEAEFQARAAQK